MFKDYKNCLTVQPFPCLVVLLMCVQKALKDRGIESMLEEARENNREYDRENLTKS